MKTKNTRWLVLAAFALVAVTFVAWKNAGPNPVRHQYSQRPEQQADTTPARKRPYFFKKDFNTRDLDDAMQELDRAMVELDKNLKVDLGNMNKELKTALGELKKIDFDKIGDEISASLKEIDWDNHKTEVKRALREAEKELKKIDKEKLRIEFDSGKMSGLSGLGDIIKNSVSVGLEAAKIGINKAKKELQLLKEFSSELEKDGLIDTKTGFKIQIKDHEMFINGKKQSKEINDKYRKYFKDGDYTFSSDGNDD